MSSSTTGVAESVQMDDYFCEIPSDPCAIVMFGASGDLAKRKLLPALFDLAIHSCLAPRFRVVGFARTQMTDEKFRSATDEALAKKGGDSKRPDFLKHLEYFTGDYDDPESYKRLAQHLDEIDQQAQLGGNRLYYLSTPPEVYPHVIEQLGRAGLAKPKSRDSWTRIIIEKPFGHDATSACKLNAKVLQVFDEAQVYRIDHYLGKETVQNILVFRFGNGIFEPLWNRNYIDHVQITASESLGVERRAPFYESAGALRDMIQSHVLQLTSIVAMESPATFGANSVRNEKIKILQSIRPFTRDSIAKSVVRGQYGPGKIDGKDVPGYRQEPGVKPDSTTETFVALKLLVDNWRWSGVPFFLRTGKRLAQPITQIAIQFKKAPHMVFQGSDVQPNSLVMNIQPDEGISLSFGAKAPGSQMQIRPVKMDFEYKRAFTSGSREAYATLINDCIRGDATLFDRADSVEAAWELVDPVLDAFADTKPSFPNYPAGSAGPEAAQELIKAENRVWRPL
ncbi:MAG TPA: glucose-6-phosphate dehydrogenase [Candidatus Baltobacteraceae bacterium]|jgi:glucose-6-phosphate 1-dehydrogenase|nr:glucose-6-phosphate dehydrogenase [Candidatus Baltobacteraceae bacterium]